MMHWTYNKKSRKLQ